jgi:hypothetical protein
MDKNGTNSGSPASPIWLICAMSMVAVRAQRGVHGRRPGAFRGRLDVLWRPLILLHSVTGPGGLRWVSARSLGPRGRPSSGPGPAGEVPDDHCRPIRCARHDPARLHPYPPICARQA